MDGLDLNKYTQQKEVKAPNSERGEQVNKVAEITGKPFKQILGLTRHLSPQQMHWLYQDSKGQPELWWWHLQNKYMNVENNPTFKEVKEKLEKFPDFRERSKRNPFLAKLSLRSLKLEEKFKTNTPLTLDEMADYAIKFGTYGRYWRSVTERHSELQGTDYLTKEQQESQMRNNLGYK